MADLKNIKQMGKPTETDKIYVADSVYKRIHLIQKTQKRVYVLMGHTECAQSGYTTFVEAAIPVREIYFSKGVPIWDNRVWNNVFSIVKKFFDNSVIIGWAIDVDGIPPSMTTELEAVHKEQFGGAHQLMFLMDSLEKEEYFYQNKAGQLRQKEGFYIYYDDAGTNEQLESIWNASMLEEKEPPLTDKDEASALYKEKNETKWDPVEPDTHPRYRELLYEKENTKTKESGGWIGTVAVFAAIVLLFAIVQTGIKQGRFSVEEIEQAVESISMKAVGMEKTEDDADYVLDSPEDIKNMLEEMEAVNEENFIEVEKIPGGETHGN